jgi:hypothetical protein
MYPSHCQARVPCYFPPALLRCVLRFQFKSLHIAVCFVHAESGLPREQCTLIFVFLHSARELIVGNCIVGLIPSAMYMALYLAAAPWLSMLYIILEKIFYPKLQDLRV